MFAVQRGQWASFGWGPGSCEHSIDEPGQSLAVAAGEPQAAVFCSSVSDFEKKKDEFAVKLPQKPTSPTVSIRFSDESVIWVKLRPTEDQGILEGFPAGRLGGGQQSSGQTSGLGGKRPIA